MFVHSYCVSDLIIWTRLIYLHSTIVIVRLGCVISLYLSIYFEVLTYYC